MKKCLMEDVQEAMKEFYRDLIYLKTSSPWGTIHAFERSGYYEIYCGDAKVVFENLGFPTMCRIPVDNGEELLEALAELSGRRVEIMTKTDKDLPDKDFTNTKVISFSKYRSRKEKGGSHAEPGH
jgi:hypothetical protein